MQWRDDWPAIGRDPDGDGAGEPVLAYRKPAVPPQPGWVSSLDSLAGRGRYRPAGIRLACVPAPAEARNLSLVPNLLLQKLPAAQFTATTRLTLHAGADGDRAGLVVGGYDYAALVLTQQGSRQQLTLAACRQANKGVAEVSTASVPLTEAHGITACLRVAARAGARYQFSYSLDGRAFTPVGPAFIAREGRWVGAEVGVFAQGGGAGGFAEFGPWVVEP